MEQRMAWHHLYGVGGLLRATDQLVRQRARVNSTGIGAPGGTGR